MNRTYEYRLYPREREQAALNTLLEQHREVYNRALEQCRNAYEATGKGQSAISQWQYFRDWRNRFDDLLLNANSLQHTLRKLDKTFSGFFRRVKAGDTPGYPRFKGKERLKSMVYTYGDGCHLRYDEDFDRFVLSVQNVGNIKIKLHRFMPNASQIKQVVIKRKATSWYVFLILELPDPLPIEPNGLPQVGADMGLLRLLTLSDGTQIDNPRWLREALADLRRAQHKLSRAKKGSQNRKEKRLIVAKLHEHITNQRRDFWHKLTFWLVHHYGVIALEKLELGFMLHNAHLSLSAHDAGLGVFQTILAYKAVDAGSHVTFVNPAYTSQACSSCGKLVEKPLSARVHSCPNPNCLLELDRDVNAAINILTLALKSARFEPSDAYVGAIQAVRSPRSSPIFEESDHDLHRATC
jgi:putative transposase